MYGMDLYLSGGIFASFVSNICAYPSHFNIHETWKIRLQGKGIILLFMSTINYISPLMLWDLYF